MQQTPKYLLTPKAEEIGMEPVRALDNGEINQLFTIVEARGGMDILGTIIMSQHPKWSQLNALPRPVFEELAENRLISLRQKNEKEWEILLLEQLRHAIAFDDTKSDSTNVSSVKAERSIFISYSSQDGFIEDQIEAELRKAYTDIWSDREFQGGERPWPEIISQIANCDVFIYLLSPDSIRSFPCRVEFAEAIRRKKQIIPVLIRRTEVPVYVRTEHNYLDAIGKNIDQVNSLISTAISKASTNITQIPSNRLWREPVARSVQSSRLVVSVKVHAKLEPVSEQKEQLNTGVIVLAGDTVEISANGLITNDISNGQPRTWIDPNGIDQDGKCSEENHAYWKQYCVGSLVGWIRGINEQDLSIAFQVGRTHAKSLKKGDTEGFIYLAVNDSMNQYHDNDGEFTVSITVTHN